MLLLRTVRPSALIRSGAAMLIRLATDEARNPDDRPMASATVEVFAPNACDRNFFPESRSEAVAPVAPAGPKTPLARFETFTSDGVCEMSRNIWPMELASLDRAASPLIIDAAVDSRPRETACPDSPRRDAISLTPRESSKLKSEDSMEVAISSPSRFLPSRSGNSGAFFIRRRMLVGHSLLTMPFHRD